MAIKIVENCRCEACLSVDADGRRHIFSDGHVVDTGPIKGPVVLSDGSVVDVTAAAVEADSAEHAAEIAHAIGLYWEKNGHPDDVDVDPKTYNRIQRPFKYDLELSKKNTGLKPRKKG